jgi:UDP-glucose 4-epimerase
MRLDGKRVLVTGAAGFIGSNLVDELVRRGCFVRAVDDFSAGKEENLADARAAGDVEVVRADICDRAAMRDAVDGVEVVMHLACSNLRASLVDPWKSHDVNGGGTLSVLEAAHAAGGIERFVYCSSSEAYGTAEVAPMAESHPTKPTTVYGASKLAGEGYAIAYHLLGMPALVVRPFNTYGYREHHEGDSGEVIPKMVVRALNGIAPVIFGDGSQTRDFTFVTDTVRGLCLAAESEDLLGRAVNIAYGREVSISRIAELVLAECAPDLQVVYEAPRPADVDRHYADTSLAAEALGFRPEVAIEEGIGKYVAWFRERYPDPSVALAEDAGRSWEASGV